MDFGAFVDLGGVEGLVHVSQLSYGRNVKVEDCVKVGDEVEVKILSLDWGGEGRREKISLSIKAALGDPWERIPHELGYAVGIKRKGRVSKLMDFGAFIEIEPGIEGLAHISQLGQTERIEKPSDILTEGQEVEVTMLAVDFDRRRISLCIGDPIVKDRRLAIDCRGRTCGRVVAKVNAARFLEARSRGFSPWVFPCSCRMVLACCTSARLVCAARIR